MLYLSSFFGRSVSQVLTSKDVEVKFADFSIVFSSEVRGNTDTFETLIGQKFLYIQKYEDEVRFHFSTSQYLSLPLRNRGEFITLKNKEKEVILMLDDKKSLD